jgi:hypothetical protein
MREKDVRFAITVTYVTVIAVFYGYNENNSKEV